MSISNLSGVGEMSTKENNLFQIILSFELTDYPYNVPCKLGFVASEEIDNITKLRSYLGERYTNKNLPVSGGCYISGGSHLFIPSFIQYTGGNIILYYFNYQTAQFLTSAITPTVDCVVI